MKESEQERLDGEGKFGQHEVDKLLQNEKKKTNLVISMQNSVKRMLLQQLEDMKGQMEKVNTDSKTITET